MRDTPTPNTRTHTHTQLRWFLPNLIYIHFTISLSNWLLNINYSNLLLVGNLIIIDMLCIYHLPAIPPEYINFYIDPEYLSFHSNSHHVYSTLACCSLLLPLTHTFDWLWQFQSHLIDPGFEWKDVSVYQHPPPPPPPPVVTIFF